VFGYGSPLGCNARAALLHRPTFPAAFTERVRLLHVPLEQGLHRPSMWISYAPVDEIVARKHVVFGQHHVLIGPQPGWEEPKVGGGAPSVRRRDRWLVLYHGVSGHSGADATLPRRVRYCAGALFLDSRDPPPGALPQGAQPSSATGGGGAGARGGGRGLSDRAGGAARWAARRVLRHGR
jgi:hypothetical protein